VRIRINRDALDGADNATDKNVNFSPIADNYRPIDSCKRSCCRARCESPQGDKYTFLSIRYVHYQPPPCYSYHRFSFIIILHFYMRVIMNSVLSILDPRGFIPSRIAKRADRDIERSVARAIHDRNYSLLICRHVFPHSSRYSSRAFARDFERVIRLRGERRDR